MPIPYPFHSSEAVTAEESPAGSSNDGRHWCSLIRVDVECEHVKNQRLRVLIHISLNFWLLSALNAILLSLYSVHLLFNYVDCVQLFYFLQGSSILF